MKNAVIIEPGTETISKSFALGEIEKKLSCEATGAPIPKIEWTTPDTDEMNSRAIHVSLI